MIKKVFKTYADIGLGQHDECGCNSAYLIHLFIASGTTNTTDGVKYNDRIGIASVVVPLKTCEHGHRIEWGMFKSNRPDDEKATLRRLWESSGWSEWTETYTKMVEAICVRLPFLDESIESMECYMVENDVILAGTDTQDTKESWVAWLKEARFNLMCDYMNENDIDYHTPMDDMRDGWIEWLSTTDKQGYHDHYNPLIFTFNSTEKDK